MAEFGHQVVTPSVASALVEVCYNGGTAYMEARRDSCGRIITGEALKLYAVNATGQWVEITSPDPALINPEPCREKTVVSYIPGCVVDPADPTAKLQRIWMLYSDGTTSAPIDPATLLTGYTTGCC